MRLSNVVQESRYFLHFIYWTTGKFQENEAIKGNRRARNGCTLLLGLIAGVAATGLLGCTAQVTSPSAVTTAPSAAPSDPPASIPPSTPSSGSTLPSEQASAAAAFVDSAGVVTHLSYTDTPYYTMFPQILSALESLGVHHIRDGYYPWPSSSPIVKAHQQLAAAGIRCDYVVPLVSSTTPQAIESFAAEVGDMDSLEAPNECDVAGNCGSSATVGIQNVIAFLPMLNTAAKNLNLPLLGPSFTDASSYVVAGNLSSDMAVNNLHVYFGGRNPGSTGWGAADSAGNAYGSFAWWLDQAALDAPGLPSAITETGYMAYPSTTIPYTLPESVQASYAPRTLLLAYNHGIQKTYLYELLDEVSSPGYGLLHSDLSPKPAFNAIANLLSLVSDPATGAFTPASLQYSITGGDSSLNHVLLQKRDGSFWLVLWLEEPSWDPVNVKPIDITPENIVLNLTSSYQAVDSYAFDASGNSTLSNPVMDGNSLSLTVTDQITIVKIASK